MASSEHYCYVLRCGDDSFYAGYTTDTLRREQEHNKGIGSKYTKARRPVRMIHKEVFGSRAEATKAEAAFKKLSRKQKENFLKVRGTQLPGSEPGGI